ncbi:hypothetical protein AVEN_274533-1 [Araneus ventricosus]|uniref:Uncharacterized protein n=1 Tax=Araneus ventricosus TaxID=182803 RepID=A0A4Y2VXQ2_ARAVE|nr:hypothetical protein AVEN_274533-1 [Araneus ventricosus]
MQFVDGMYGLYLDPDFEPVKSPLGSPRASVTSVTSCTSTLSTQSGGKDSSKQRSAHFDSSGNVDSLLKTNLYSSDASRHILDGVAALAAFTSSSNLTYSPS